MIADSLNHFFVNIAKELASEVESDTDINDSDFRLNRQRDVIFNFSEIHIDEVTQQLSNLKISESTCIDNIPAKALKLATSIIIAPSQTWIFNPSIRTGIYVNEWKKARVVPIYKSNERQIWENCLTISILPVVSTILERSIFNQIYKFLNYNAILSKYQASFRPKNSTLTALLQMCYTFYENMDSGKLNGVVFLDIRKAFDSIDHTIFLQKMRFQFGITNTELEWFSSYFNKLGTSLYCKWHHYTTQKDHL